MNISGFRPAALVALVPGGYFAGTRLRTPRDIAYLVLSQWIPAWWLVVRSGTSIGDSLAGFAAGMIAFLAFYELGYFANDVWDARRASDGRPRLKTVPGAGYTLVFVALRLAAWAFISWSMGWLEIDNYVVGYAALAIVFTIHNLVRAPEPRLASFLSLATLRFLLPVIALLSSAILPAAIAAAVLLYAYLRFLSYADSKALLAMPRRRGADFGLTQIAILAPLVAAMAYWLKSWPLVELLAWYLAIHGAVYARGKAVHS